MKPTKLASIFNDLLATWFGCGKFPVAQGTLTSLATILLWLMINKIFGWAGLTNLFIIAIWPPLIIILFIVGVRAAEYYSQKINHPDPKQVVIDEVVGQLITLFIGYCCISLNSSRTEKILSGDLLIYFYTISSFVFFRFFDILKPFYIGFIDQNIKGGLGIMLDDVAAGFTAGLCICCFYISTLIL